MLTPFYQSDTITIYHGDSRVILPQLGQFDLLCADPPYGIGADKQLKARVNAKNGNSLAKHRDYGGNLWDDQPVPFWLMQQMIAQTRYQIIFGGNYYPLPPSACWLVWNKINGRNDYADCELAWTNLPKSLRMISWRWSGMLQEVMAHKEERVHPTQKPEPVMRWAILQAPKDIKTVLDPFAGSGTTLIAAQNLGLTAVGIEREEKYCEIAAKRLEDTSRYIHDLTAYLPPPKNKKAAKEETHTPCLFTTQAPQQQSSPETLPSPCTMPRL